MTDSNSTNDFVALRKWCDRCRKVKKRDKFGKDASRKDGLSEYCKPCKRALYWEWVDRHPQNRYAGHLRQYGLSYEQYEKMLWDQNGLCAICGRRQSKAQSERLHVDHDHKTGAVRALLCMPCNMGLGHFEDDIDRMERAIQYLKQHKACN